MILCSLLNVDIIPGVRPDRKKIVALLLFGLVVPAGLRIIGTTYSRSGTSTSPNGKGSFLIRAATQLIYRLQNILN